MKKLITILVFGSLICMSIKSYALDPRIFMSRSLIAMMTTIDVKVYTPQADCNAMEYCEFYVIVYAYRTSPESLIEKARQLYVYETNFYDFQNLSFDAGYDFIGAKIVMTGGECYYSYTEDYGWQDYDWPYEYTFYLYPCQ